ncbi:hypothetical protein F4859DRAFT_524408 [Xylaria cf. heliscus]|nr:hypothetical protein F4859DRAFT_524408 [Xylaria cf. heliscus]
MHSHASAASGSSPAGDIGNHVVPKLLIILASIVVFFAVAIRLFARHLMKKFGIPDILLLISLAFFIGHAYNAYQVAIYPGSGVHQWQYNPELAANSHYNLKFGSILFGLNIVFLKTAILVDWIYFFVPRRNILYRVIVGLIWSNGIFYFIGTFIEIFQCAPEDVGTSKCKVDLDKFTIASGIINVISDLTILLIPHWVVWRLKLTTARKMGVSVLFLIGFLATGSAIARVAYVTKLFRTGDFAFYSVQVNIAAVSEQTFGYLVIGVPAIPKAFQSLSRARPGPQSNISNQSRQGPAWPGSISRRYPLEAGEPDTHVLVTMADGEPGDIAQPAPARVYERHHMVNSPRVGEEQKWIEMGSL